MYIERATTEGTVPNTAAHTNVNIGLQTVRVQSIDAAENQAHC